MSGSGLLFGLPMMKVGEYVIPVTRIQKTDFQPSKDLSKSSRQMQHISGWMMPKDIQTLLWEGAGLTANDFCVPAGTHAIHGSIAKLVVRSASTATAQMPREMCTSAARARTDLEGSPIASNEQIAGFMNRNNRTILQEFPRNGQCMTNR